jgi:MFS family permease
MRNPWRGLAGLPREIWILFTASIVNRAGMMVLPMLIIYLTRELGFTPARAGFVFAVFGITAIIVGPIAGRLSDRFGTVVLMRASLLLSGVVLLFYPLARSYGAVLAVTVLWAAVNELFRPSALAAITDVAPPEKRKAAFAVFRLAINLGMSIGPALGGFLAAVSFRAMFYVDGITSILGGIVLSLFAWREHGSDSGEPHPHQSGLSVGLLSPSFLIFLTGIFLLGIVFFQHEGAMPLFLVRELGMSPAFYGLLFTINTLLIVAIEVPLNAATAHWNHRSSMAIACLLFATGFGALAFVTSATGVIATVVVWTFGEMLFFPSMAAHMGDVAEPGRRGAYMGAQSMAMSSAFALGPWLGTAVFEHFGSTTLWLLMFAIGVVAAVLVSGVKPRAVDLRVAAGAES